jgi:hypothetical protein
LANNKKKKKGGGSAKSGGQGNGFPIVAVIVTVLVIAVGIGAGILIWSQTSSNDGGDIALETGIELPDFINHPDAPDDAEKAYRVALTIPDDLAQVPCYCGCSADGHKSNLDCFIKQRDGDNVLFDDHAAY